MSLQDIQIILLTMVLPASVLVFAAFVLWIKIGSPKPKKK